MMENKMIPKLVILDGNALSLLGLKTLLQRVIPHVEVWAFSSFDELEALSSTPIAHYFVSSRMLIEHSAFFLQRQHQTIVLVSGTHSTPLTAKFHTIDINGDEQQLVRNLLRLMEHAHSHGRNLPPELMQRPASTLSAREIEVLSFIVRGFLNKEIADQLNISITTVITHRKNIMDKLSIRSISGLTIYAVVNGYVEAGEI